jgi:hypothetical protein
VKHVDLFPADLQSAPQIYVTSSWTYGIGMLAARYLIQNCSIPFRTSRRKVYILYINRDSESRLATAEFATPNNKGL